jgi:asparagine synthetase B (glutamine-hydrolysing)
MGAIAGIVPRANFGREQLTTAIRAMRDALRRRAPLEGGLAVAYDASVALAHRGGTGPGAEAVLQPFRNERGTLWLVADGEPANATELRLELVAAGHRFQSGCGSEVILHLYEQDGIGALERLAGSFAFALWDREQHELLLGRDRFGAKPLYLSERGGAFTFASEVRALRGDEILDPAALLAYLVFGYVPEPITVVRGVTAVAPGTLVRVRGTRVRVERFWEEASAWPSGQREVDRARFGGLLRDAVEAAIEGEDDVGIVVDGSPASAALLALVRPMLGRGLRTHVFDFASTGDRQTPVRDPRARRDTVNVLADWFRGEHRQHRIEGAAVTSAFASAAAADQPSAGTTFSTLATAAMRGAGERVWLAGLATPQLLGVDTARMVSWLWRAGRHGSTKGLARVVARIWARHRPFGRAAALAGYVGPSDAIAPAYLATRGLFGPDGLARLIRGDALAHARSAFDAAAYVDARALAPLGPPCVLPAGSAHVAIERAVAAVELAGPLMSGALRDAEASAVAHGLALRAPFLDHRLHEWLTSGGAALDRSPLLSVLEGVLPQPLYRKLAPPSPPPVARWLRNELRSIAEEHLLAEDRDGLFHVEALADLWKAFSAGRTSWKPVWSLLTVRAWMNAVRERTRTAGTEGRRRAA